MHVYTYYDPSVNLAHPAAPMLTAWSRSWKRAGFDPVILNPVDARKHPRFEEFSRLVAQYPTRNPKAYEMACYQRWLAYAAAGVQGLVSDFDVLNHKLRDSDVPTDLPLAFLAPHRVPCLVYLNSAGATILISAIQSYAKPFDIDHVSDMTIFQDTPDLSPASKGPFPCVEYGAPGWSEASVVHFAHGAVRRLGFASKHQAFVACSRLFV